jgi:hypothetical protein
MPVYEGFMYNLQFVGLLATAMGLAAGTGPGQERFCRG